MGYAFDNLRRVASIDVTNEYDCCAERPRRDDIAQVVCGRKRTDAARAFGEENAVLAARRLECAAHRIVASPCLEGRHLRDVNTVLPGNADPPTRTSQRDELTRLCVAAVEYDSDRILPKIELRSSRRHVVHQAPARRVDAPERHVVGLTYDRDRLEWDHVHAPVRQMTRKADGHRCLAGSGGRCQEGKPLVDHESISTARYRATPASVPIDMTSELEPWTSLTPEEAAIFLSDAPFRWWVTGGRALELYVGKSWRPHVDLDIGFPRNEAPAVRAFLQGLDVFVFSAGALRPWHSETLDRSRGENNVWCRRSVESPWLLDLTAAEGDETAWIDRLNAHIQVRWSDAIVHSPEGIPYLAPELALFEKSREMRLKDHQDAARVLPRLDSRRHQRLAEWLPPGHSWQPR